MNEKILEMLKNAVMDYDINCPYCEYGNLEPDYSTCPECNKKNPLQTYGLI